MEKRSLKSELSLRRRGNKVAAERGRAYNWRIEGQEKTVDVFVMKKR